MATSQALVVGIRARDFFPGRITVSFSFGIFLLVFAVVWISVAAIGIYKQPKAGARPNWPVGIAGFLVLVGAVGFFGSALAATGVVKPPASFEWPVGHAHHVVTTPDGKYVVGLEPSGRIQIYDPERRFLRGWQVNAEGGDFTIVVSDSGLLSVYTQRGHHLYVYTGTGELISSSSYAGDFSSISSGRSMALPTSLLLWPFSSPFGCWGLSVLGAVCMKVLQRGRPTFV
jgi:hypothetical protein